jgi:CBS-domain-containing membrane protein
MARTQAHLDAMLRHLGAAYYESLHGRASAADVARARAAVEERLAEQPAARSPGMPGTGPKGAPHHHGRWHSRVRDVMTRDVVTVDRITGYKEIAGLLAKHHISAVPVLVMGRHVAGVVSEDDLLAARDTVARRAGQPGRLPRPLRRSRPHRPLTAGEMMTAPAVTIHPDATIAQAARLMHTHHVKRLPVVDPDGKLIGVVSRSDLLSVCLRPDAQIVQEVRDLLAEILLADPAGIKVGVRGGVVTLTAERASAGQDDLIPVAVKLIWDIDGVVDVKEALATAPGDGAAVGQARGR